MLSVPCSGFGPLLPLPRESLLTLCARTWSAFRPSQATIRFNKYHEAKWPGFSHAGTHQRFAGEIEAEKPVLREVKRRKTKKKKKTKQKIEDEKLLIVDERC